MMESSGPIIPGVRRIEAKTIEVTVGDNGEVTVYFEKPFDKTPIVTINLWEKSRGQAFANIIEVTNTYFKFRIIAGFVASAPNKTEQVLKDISYNRVKTLVDPYISFSTTSGYIVKDYDSEYWVKDTDVGWGDFVTSVSGDTHYSYTIENYNLRRIGVYPEYKSVRLCDGSCDSGYYKDYGDSTTYRLPTSLNGRSWMYDVSSDTDDAVDFYGETRMSMYTINDLDYYSNIFVGISDYWEDYVVKYPISKTPTNVASNDHSHDVNSSYGIYVPTNGQTYKINYIAIEVE